MNYAEVRGRIKSGDLIALTHKSWNSLYDLQVQAVRIGTESEYCHVCVAWVVAGRVFVIESVTPVVRIFPLSNLQDHGFYWMPVGEDYPMTEEELRFGLARVGLGEYSKVEAVLGQFGVLKIGEDELWMCAELTVVMRRLSGLDLGPKATPAAVVEKAQESGYPVYLVLNDKNDEGT